MYNTLEKWQNNSRYNNLTEMFTKYWWGEGGSFFTLPQNVIKICSWVQAIPIQGDKPGDFKSVCSFVELLGKSLN